jgi:hypothetical protein
LRLCPETELTKEKNKKEFERKTLERKLKG